MNYLDIIIAVVVVYFIVLGVRKGIVTMFMGIAGFILALITATGLMSLFSGILQELTGMPKGLGYIISSILIFFFVLLVCRGITNIILKLFTITSTRWIDRVGGGIFGFCIGGLIVSALLIMLTFIPFSDRLLPGKENSLLYPCALNFFPAIYDNVVILKPSAKSFQEIVEDIINGDLLESVNISHTDRGIIHTSAITLLVFNATGKLNTDNTSKCVPEILYHVSHHL